VSVTEIFNGGRRARILIVEDDPVSAILIQKIFDRQGIRADCAQTGVQALDMHRKRGYRVVISDWLMPEMSGVDLCRELRKLSGAYCYFILCSSKGQRDERMEAFEAGVDDFLAKPIDPEELQARLKVARRFLSIEDDLQHQNDELERAHDRVHAMNASLMLASKRFEELFNGLPVACFTFDQEGLVHEWNRAAFAKFGIEPHEALQKPVWEVLDDGEHRFWSPDFVYKIFHEDSSTTVDWKYQSSSGETRYFACNVFCLKNNSGEILGAISANLDITERELAEQRIHTQIEQINQFAVQLEEQKRALVQANEKLQHLAVTDGLTGLWNHRRFHEELDKRLIEAAQTKKPLSLILLDIDHFKSFNDTYGHQSGDDLLRQFARILREQSRGTDFPARYGGEEFAMILNGAAEKDAIETAERFRKAIETEPWSSRAVTASFGVATLNKKVTTARELIENADQALYKAKSSGRNQVCHFNSIPPQLERSHKRAA
jgi:two-component system cell cycle response regulator